MSPDSQRIAIAEACGWEPLPEGHFHPDNPVGQTMPDYLVDLNAMHEAEQILWGMDWSNRYAFNDNLANTLKGRTVNRNEWDAETLLDATAAQRAEAFLRTIGKWEDEAL